MRIYSGDEIIDSEYSTIVIAEVSANHGQDFQKALKMISVAKNCGADMVKFQAYTPDTITIDCDKPYFVVQHEKWGGQTMYELYQKAYTPWGWFPDLKKCCDDVGIGFLCTAYDKTSVDLLEKLDVSRYKIASFELIDIPFLEYVADTDKDVILSTGMATVGEIAEAVQVFDENQQLGDLALLKCLSSYPANPLYMNLKTIPHMKELFHCSVGLSDHTLDIGVSIAAVALGAEIIEKHFTLSRKDKSPDSFFSIEPDDLKNLTSQVLVAKEALGHVRYGLSPSEEVMRKIRRSLFAVEDIKQGEILTKDNIRSIRPADGIAPKHLFDVLEKGKRAKVDIERGTPLAWELIK